MTDLYGQALLDYQNSIAIEDILTYSSIAGKDIMPLDYLFRRFKDMPKIEQKALELCSGKILDIGCGSGSHSLYLQQNVYDRTQKEKLIFYCQFFMHRIKQHT